MSGPRQTARHEAAHAYAAETLGIPVGWATVKRDGDACGHVTPADLWPKHPDTLTVMLAAYHSAKARGDAPEGHEGDFDQAEHFATLLADSEEEATRLWREAHVRAAELVRAPEWEHVTERIADALVARWEQGFGLLASELGTVIAEARAEHAQSQRLYGMPAPRETLTGCTPSEELAKRSAVIAELGNEEPSSAARGAVEIDYRTVVGRRAAVENKRRHFEAFARARGLGKEEVERLFTQWQQRGGLDQLRTRDAASMSIR